MIPKILIVDDDEDIVPLFTQMFKNELKNGLYEFIFKFSASEANQYVQSVPAGTISLMLSDIRMPDKNGIELLKELREKSDIPVFLFTAYDDEVVRKSAEFFKANKYFQKPINFTELRQEIKNIVVTK